MTTHQAALLEALRTQTQLDAHGCMVGVSRQAVDEAIAIIEAELGWQPIEAAPKDGSSIVLYDPRHTNPVIGYWFSANESRGWWVFATLVIHPTHWRPLPAPPEPKQEGQ